MSKPKHHDIELEQHILGSMLIDEDARERSLGVLTSEDFYKILHRQIFDHIKQLADDSSEVDAVVVSSMIEDEIDKTYPIDLLNHVVGSSNVNMPIKKLREMSTLRRAADVMKRHLSGKYTLSSALEQLEAIRNIDIDQGFGTTNYWMHEVIDYLERMHKNDPTLIGAPTGYQALDNILGGMRKGHLIIVAGRPSMGKTALAVNILRNVSVEQGLTSAMFSLEMSTEEVMTRLLMSECRMTMSEMSSMESDHLDRVIESAARLQNASIFVDDKPNVSIREMYSKCRELKKKHGLGVVVVDYLQLLSGNSRSREEEVSKFSRHLKIMAKMLEVPVIALSQLNRGCEYRSPPRPRLSDLRESGAIEQDADVVVMLYRPSEYDPTEDQGKTEVIVAKQRSGPTGVTSLNLDKSCMRFMDTAERSML